MHKFDIEMTANITETVAMNMIVAAVEKQTGRQVSDIKLKYDGTKFDGFHVTFDAANMLASTVKRPFVPSKEFIVTHYE